MLGAVRRESTYEFGLQDNTGALQGAFGPGCWRWWGTANIPAGSWTHVGAGVDGTNEKHFVNGVFVEQDGCAGSLTINDDDFMIGARGGDGAHGSQFRGAVDEAMVFGSMLSDNEVAAIYASFVGGGSGAVAASDLPDSLVGYWPLDANGIDVSGNGLTGSFVNAVRHVFSQRKLLAELSTDGTATLFGVVCAMTGVRVWTVEPSLLSDWR